MGAVSLESALRGNRLALSRAISCVEDGTDAAPGLIKAAYPHASGAWVVGITGGTGCGKSTLVDALVSHYRSAGDRVGVVAVDPTSPFSGGALLGDRVRMTRHGTDRDVFVRSMATRGASGGLAATTFDVVTLLAAAGMQRLIVETVGVGQEEIDVAGVAHTTCVVVTPAGGDEVQAIKAGIMEIADIVVLNKADLPGADRALAQLRGVISHAPDSNWVPPIVRTQAVDGEGIKELADALERHREWCGEAGLLVQKRRTVASLRLRAVLAERIWERARAALADDGAAVGVGERLDSGEIDPYSAADELLDSIGLDRSSPAPVSMEPGGALSGVLQAREFDHVAMAVLDADAAVARYGRLLGATVEHRETVDDQGVEVIFLRMPDATRLELLCPLGDGTPVGRFLAERGEGLHHICFRVDDLQAALTGAEAAGVALIDHKPRRGAGGSLIAFVRPSELGGVLVELKQKAAARPR